MTTKNQNDGNLEQTTTEALDTSFNLTEDFKQDPLIPQGNYFGAVTEVKRDAEKFNLCWKVTLDGNGGYMNDGETPVDGSSVYVYNYFPKASDRTEMTKGGKSTKFQSKVNMLKQFADALKVDMNTLEIIDESIANGDWIGKQVSVKVTVDEYPAGSGKFNNKGDKMVAAD